MPADDIEPVMAEGSYDWRRIKVERLEADVQAALAERDQQFERKCEALRERDEARRERDDLRARLTGVSIHAYRLMGAVTPGTPAWDALVDLRIALDIPSAPQRPENTTTRTETA